MSNSSTFLFKRSCKQGCRWFSFLGYLGNKEWQFVIPQRSRKLKLIIQVPRGIWGSILFLIWIQFEICFYWKDFFLKMFFWPSWLNFSSMEENFLLLAAFFGWRRKFVFFLIYPVFSTQLWRLSPTARLARKIICKKSRLKYDKAPFSSVVSYKILSPSMVTRPNGHPCTSYLPHALNCIYVSLFNFHVWILKQF